MDTFFIVIENLSIRRQARFFELSSIILFTFVRPNWALVIVGAIGMALPELGSANTDFAGLITIHRQVPKCEVLLMNPTQSVPGRVGLFWLSMFESNFQSLHKEVIDAWTSPVAPMFGVERFHKLTPDFRLTDASIEIGKAIDSISKYDDPQIYFYLDSHGYKSGSTCLMYDGDVHNSKVLDSLLQPMVDFVRTGKSLTLNLMINTCFAGVYIDGVKALAAKHTLPQNFTINVITAVPADIKAVGNTMFNEIQAAQMLLATQTNQQSATFALPARIFNEWPWSPTG